MKRSFLQIILLVLFAGVCLSQSMTWNLDNLKKIGGHKVEILGQPKVIKTDNGRAIEFDGVDDGILIETNPLAGANALTIEAWFRPDADGPAEQRWLHVEDLENVESRAMLETRVTKDQWFLDTFFKSGENRLPLYAETFKHPTGRWYHVALVYDGTEMRHYIDGKLELSGKIAMRPFGQGRVSIGVRQNKVYWFKGAIRKVRFSHGALRPENFLRQ
ncbi:MAG: LamG domain-containing protein [Pyrinomonadaceae bacterium]